MAWKTIETCGKYSLVSFGVSPVVYGVDYNTESVGKLAFVSTIREEAENVYREKVSQQAMEGEKSCQPLIL